MAKLWAPIAKATGQRWWQSPSPAASSREKSASEWMTAALEPCRAFTRQSLTCCADKADIRISQRPIIIGSSVTVRLAGLTTSESKLTSSIRSLNIGQYFSHSSARATASME